MRFDWTAECGADDPVLEVPWAAPGEAGAACRFVDLRDDPDALDLLAEADAHPALHSALRSLNGTRSPVFTAKCDVWSMDAAELAHTRDALDLIGEANALDAAAGQASYIDLLPRERGLFVSSHRQEQLCHRLARLLEPLDQTYALAEAVLRPAFLDLNGPQEGFALSLYVKAVGADAAEADGRWGRALEAVAALVRSREFSA